LSEISFSAQIVNLFRKTLEKLFEKDDYQWRDEIQKTKKKLEKLESRKSNLQNDFMDLTITSQDYKDLKGRVEKELVLLKDKLTELQQKISPFKVYIQNEVPMLENLLEYYRKSDGATKKNIINTIFAEKLIVINGKVTAPVFTEPKKLMFWIRESIANLKEKNEIDVDLKFCQSCQN
jgi:chromosome segregation ATPase